MNVHTMRYRHLIAPLVLWGAMGLSAPAQASSFPSPCLGDCSPDEFTSTTYIFIGTTLAAGLTYAGLTSWWYEAKETPQREQKKKEAIKRYLDEHARLLIEGATLGAGPGVDDLATICQIDHARRHLLVTWLRTHRAQISSLAMDHTSHGALADLIVEGLREA